MNSFHDRLLKHVEESGSRLCVGLDVDPDRLTSIASPALDDLKSFSRMVIDATMDHVVCYKLNLAFFERFGSEGFRWLEEVLDYIDNRRLIIADGKRGDISNSARHYAGAIFDHFGFDAATVNPYMGRDAIGPFVERAEKGAFVICLTSNKGSSDLQFQRANGQLLYQKVVALVKELNVNRNCGLVVGATREGQLEDVRKMAGDMPFLIPGVGAQGGDLQRSVQKGNMGGVALINVSRGILYASDQSAGAIRKAARDYHSRIDRFLTG